MSSCLNHTLWHFVRSGAFISFGNRGGLPDDPRSISYEGDNDRKVSLSHSLDLSKAVPSASMYVCTSSRCSIQLPVLLFDVVPYSTIEKPSPVLFIPNRDGVLFTGTFEKRTHLLNIQFLL